MHSKDSVITAEDSDRPSSHSRRHTGSFSAVAVAKNPRYELLPPPPQNDSDQLTTDYVHYENLLRPDDSGEDEGDYATVHEFRGTD